MQKIPEMYQKHLSPNILKNINLFKCGTLFELLGQGYLISLLEIMIEVFSPKTLVWERRQEYFPIKFSLKNLKKLKLTNKIPYIKITSLEGFDHIDCPQLEKLVLELPYVSNLNLNKTNYSKLKTLSIETEHVHLNHNIKLSRAGFIANEEVNLSLVQKVQRNQGEWADWLHPEKRRCYPLECIKSKKMLYPLLPIDSLSFNGFPLKDLPSTISRAIEKKDLNSAQ